MGHEPRFPCVRKAWPTVAGFLLMGAALLPFGIGGGMLLGGVVVIIGAAGVDMVASLLAGLRRRVDLARAQRLRVTLQTTNRLQRDS